MYHTIANTTLQKRCNALYRDWSLCAKHAELWNVPRKPLDVLNMDCSETRNRGRLFCQVGEDPDDVYGLNTKAGRGKSASKVQSSRPGHPRNRAEAPKKKRPIGKNIKDTGVSKRKGKSEGSREGQKGRSSRQDAKRRKK